MKDLNHILLEVDRTLRIYDPCLGAKGTACVKAPIRSYRARSMRDQFSSLWTKPSAKDWISSEKRCLSPWQDCEPQTSEPNSMDFFRYYRTCSEKSDAVLYTPLIDWTDTSSEAYASYQRAYPQMGEKAIRVLSAAISLFAKNAAAVIADSLWPWHGYVEESLEVQSERQQERRRFIQRLFAPLILLILPFLGRYSATVDRIGKGVEGYIPFVTWARGSIDSQPAILQHAG